MLFVKAVLQYTVQQYTQALERDTGPSPLMTEEYMSCPVLWILGVGLTNEPVPGAQAISYYCVLSGQYWLQAKPARDRC